VVEAKEKGWGGGARRGLALRVGAGGKPRNNGRGVMGESLSLKPILVRFVQKADGGAGGWALLGSKIRLSAVLTRLVSTEYLIGFKRAWGSQKNM